MFGIGLPEMIVILAVALIVVGPDKLPDLARSLAKGINEMRNAMNQVKESLSEETKVVSSVQQDLQKTAGQMKTHLLDDITSNPTHWKQEGGAKDVEDVEDAENNGVIEAESLPSHLQEEDGAAGAQEKEQTEDSPQNLTAEPQLGNDEKNGGEQNRQADTVADKADAAPDDEQRSSDTNDTAASSDTPTAA
ncbi:MAG: Sec-independent protein translocase protein TatB [Candidatus Electrothrix sp. YB6]